MCHQFLGRAPLTREAGKLSLFVCALFSLIGLSSTSQAQTFAPIPGLSFVKPYTGANPLPQTLTVASKGSTFRFYANASTTSGGNWLSISTPVYPQGCGPNLCLTPETIAVTVNANPTLDAGSYTGQIVLQAQSSSATLTVPVTLTVASSGNAYFDNLLGQVSFSIQTAAAFNPPAQNISLRNAGSGTLTWTASATTSDGGQWLSLSANSGTAPSKAIVTFLKQNLPGAGANPGTFIGNLLFQTATGNVTVPVSVVVGDNVFQQTSALAFTKVFGGPNPLPQTIAVASTGADFNFYIQASTGAGGAWLGVTNNGGCPYALCSTARTITVSANPAVTLAAGTYTAQIVLSEQHSTMSITVPVTLTIAPTGATYFDNLPGQISFSVLRASQVNPAAQSLQVRNAGSGLLDWTLEATTSDGGGWLIVSATSGTSPSTVTVGVIADNLPYGGLIAGTFTGNLTFLSSDGNVTVPISVVVGASTFQQINAFSFSKAFGGANPLPQTLSVASTGANFNFYAAVSTANGGNWLSITVNGGCGGSCSTPQAITAVVNPSVTLEAGTYTAQIVLVKVDGSSSITVPVTLTIAPVGIAYFDNLPGQISFSTQTSSALNPPSQIIQLRNGVAGTLNWTLSAITSDGGNWLMVSAVSGAAPSFVTVGIQRQDLPGEGLVDGTFTGALTFQSLSGSITVPISVVVGDNVFEQVNPISFTKVYQGANPLSQILAITSTGASFNYRVIASTGTGGSWLMTNTINGCCQFPQALTVAVNPNVSLAAGTYTGQIVIVSGDGSQSQTVPVTLTIAPAGSIYFDNLQGQMTFSMRALPDGIAPANQTIQIRSGGSGTLAWTLISTTSDGGNWLTTSSASGTTRTNLTVGVNLANLPGLGQSPGTFTGQLLFLSGTSSITIPVCVTVGNAAFLQSAPLTFLEPAGGPNPPSQTLTVASTNTTFVFYPSAQTATGGNWLSIATGGCQTCLTPRAIQVTVNPSPNLAQGTYTGQIVFFNVAIAGSMSMTIPVTLIVGNGGIGSTTDPGPFQFVQVSPCRLVDTRRATGSFGGPIMSAGQTREFDIPTSACGIPPAAAAYSLNVTVVPSGPLGFLTTYQAGQSRPLASTLNSDGRVKANAAIVPAGSNGGVDVFVTDQTHVIIDIDGYFVPTAGLEFFHLPPCRIVDTRKSPGPLAGPSLAALTSRTVPILSSSCGIPATAQAYSLNVTALPHATLSFLTAFPSGTARPVASTLNASTGTVTANAAIVPAGASGNVDVFVTDNADVLIDTNGYFAPAATGGLSLYTKSPCRIEDTRQPSGTPPKSGTTTVPVSTSSCQVPAGAQAYVMNATVVPPGAPLGWLTLWPDGAPQPVASTLNAFDGAVTSNMAIVPTTNGNIQTFAENPTYVILDIMAYFAP